ncbi:hypothetical protein MJT46_013807 [Ovis ammon polii x Ovis aries]|nr:hypothetical protein MJT46_013807 [Ovis ammon polii x Ovis aries]
MWNSYNENMFHQPTQQAYQRKAPQGTEAVLLHNLMGERLLPGHIYSSHTSLWTKLLLRDRTGLLMTEFSKLEQTLPSNSNKEVTGQGHVDGHVGLIRTRLVSPSSRFSFSYACAPQLPIGRKLPMAEESRTGPVPASVQGSRMDNKQATKSTRQIIAAARRPDSTAGLAGEPAPSRLPPAAVTALFVKTALDVVPDVYRASAVVRLRGVYDSGCMTDNCLKAQMSSSTHLGSLNTLSGLILKHDDQTLGGPFTASTMVRLITLPPER